MKKTTNTHAVIAIILATISLTMSALNCNATHYATINGESFSIPKIEGEGYYEKDTNCVR